jgi:hypothetical protein
VICNFILVFQNLAIKNPKKLNSCHFENNIKSPIVDNSPKQETLHASYFSPFNFMIHNTNGIMHMVI